MAAIAIGAGVGVIMNGIANLQNGQNFWKGAGKAALLGGAQGASSFGIGAASGNFFMQAVGHGLEGGFFSYAQGGTFKSGFISGAFSSVVASGIQGLHLAKGINVAATVLSGGVTGGLGSVLSGGTFIDGARNGIITAGLNHAMHMAASSLLKDGGPDDPKKKAYQVNIEDNQGATDHIEVVFDASTNTMEKLEKYLAKNYGLGLAQARKAALSATVLSRTTTLLTAYNAVDDINSYNEGKIGGVRLTYKLTGTTGGLLVGTVSGGIAGLTTGLGFMTGEMFYDIVKPYTIEFTNAVAHLEYSLKNGWMPGK